MYHVYQNNGQSYLSMLSPGDWGGNDRRVTGGCEREGGRDVTRM